MRADMFEQAEKNAVHSANTVGIVGCGWLGTALAQHLIIQQISVLATSSQQKHVDGLNQQGINAQQLILPANVISLVQHDVFKQHNLVIAITPQFKQGRQDYADKVMQLINAAEQQGCVKRIILLSSTAIYDGALGHIDENHALDISHKKVQILDAAEQAVIHFSPQGIILRLAGLVGPKRHPGKFILANKALSNTQAAVNLIHQQDAVGLIMALLHAPLSTLSDQANKKTSVIFNGVSDTHISKANYYLAAAKALGLKPPMMYEGDSPIRVRIVCGNKAKHLLAYKFVYPDLLTWL